MARLNIEDQFWLEAMAVASQAGINIDTFTGNALRFFRYAQEKHKRGSLISDEEFKALGFLEALIPVFARRVEGGVQAGGADRFFGWLMDKKESGTLGGQKSVEGRQRDEKGRLMPKQDPSTIQAESKQPKQSQAPAKQPPSGTKLHQPSPSSSLSGKEKEKIRALALEAYELYPRKEGKSRGMVALGSQLRSVEDAELFVRRVREYAAAKAGTELKYIKLFDSFVGPDNVQPWRDEIPGPNSNKNAVPLNAPKPITTSAKAQALIDLIVKALRSDPRTGLVAMKFPLQVAGIAEMVEEHWGGWTRLPIQQAEREVAVFIASLESKNRIKGAS